jgi:sterol desaturase/sphingolipid hydroxylase (fatty acid hydroxylase superfamily)
VNLILYAIPLFFLLIGLELVVARRRGIQVYRFNDAISDLSCGIVNQLLAVLFAIVSAAVYGALVSSVALFEIDPASPWMWLLCFLGVDCCYYWFHRASHEINFLWAAHVVHHQSEEYNLAVALRQSALQPGFSWVFYLPLAVIGFPLEMFVALASLNTIYQFWIHTRLIDRMGPLEWILNTPSHHRVHHGQNPKYIDRNHAGTLIVWDMIFGTFQREEDEVVYGVTEPVASWNPLWVNAHTWVTTARRARSFPRLRDRIAVWFHKPGWVPGGEAKPWMPAPKYDPIVRRATARYVLAQFTLATIGTVVYIFIAKRIPIHAAALAFAIALTLLALGGILEHRRWARILERFRPAILALVAFSVEPQITTTAAVTLPILLVAGLSIYWHEKTYVDGAADPKAREPVQRDDAAREAGPDVAVRP